MKENPIRIRAKLLGLIFFPLLIVFVALLGAPNLNASAETIGEWGAFPYQESEPISTEECLSCHQLPDMHLPLESGERLNLTVDPDVFANSAHGQNEMLCTDCHSAYTTYPHLEFPFESRQAARIAHNDLCIECHTKEADVFAKGRHAQEFVKGNHDTALCVDCHTAHPEKATEGSKVEVAKTCQQCHASIYDIYKNSVHGVALLDDDNFDVPTCSDCHENHDTTGPGDAGFILFSPNICQDCHADEALMAKYDIRSDVFDTYVADFHGTTVTIFEDISPDQETNKPVCIDCHGVHDILSADDENSSVMKANLLETCRRCHPDATSDFSDSWMGHYSPDIDHNPLVYLVNLFYYVIIPGTMGGIILFIGTDIWRTIKNRAGDKDGGENA